MKFIYVLNIYGQSLLEYFYSKNISVLIWDDNIKKWDDYIPATQGVLVGGFDLLKEWMVRSIKTMVTLRRYIW